MALWRCATHSPAWLLLAALAGAAALTLGLPRWSGHIDQHGVGWKAMAWVENISPQHGFTGIRTRVQTRDGISYRAYHRRPVVGPLLIKLATLPFPDDAVRRINAARALVLAFFAGAAALGWMALRRLGVDDWIALAAVLLAFSSSHALWYADLLATEAFVQQFAVMLAFHGLAVFAAEGRFGQLLAKTCAALLLGWHVFALVGPLALWCLGGALRRRDWRSARRYFALGAVALLFGSAVLGVNIARERSLFGDTPVAELPSVASALARTGIDPQPRQRIDWDRFPAQQLHSFVLATAPSAVSQFAGRQLGGAAQHVWAGLPGFAIGGAALLLTTIALLLRRPSPPRHPRRPNTSHARELLALALAGSVWAIVMRHQTQVSSHSFDALLHLGVPLVFFSLTLPALAPAPAARRWLGLGATLVFALSAALSARAWHDPAGVERVRTLAADADAALAFAQGKRILKPPGLSYLMRRYLLRGTVEVPWTDFDLWGLAEFALDDKLAPGGTPVPTLTPHNRLRFLYRRQDYEEALQRYAALAAARAPEAVSATWNVHYLANEGFGDDLLYVRADCPPSFDHNTEPRFFLHVHPVDPDVLHKHRRKQATFDSLDFDPHWLWRAANRCTARVRLPDYPIAMIRTGQFSRQRLRHGIRFQNHWEALIRPAGGQRGAPAERRSAPAPR